MLEGLEITILTLQSFKNDNIDFRLDAEYFSKESIRLLDVLSKKGFRKISDFSFVTDGIHSSIDYSDDSRINLISATSPKQNIFDLSRKAYISSKAHFENPRTALKENDIILSTVGTIGNCAVVTNSILPANSDRHVGIIRTDDTISPYYVSTFLLSKYGIFQSFRESTGNVQLNLFIYKIRTLKIANASTEFQLNIENVIKKSHSNLELSKSLYNQSEQILFEDLNLSEWKPIETNTSIKSFSNSYAISGRLDAEYYQPKFDEVLQVISNEKHKNLGSIATFKKSIEPGSVAYQTEGIPFIRVSDISKFGLSHPEIHLDRNEFDLDDLKPKKDTILLSKDGSVGIAYKVEQDLDVITSSALLHLTITDKEVLPDYLTLVLNSKLTQMQAERDAGGSIIQHWRPDEIKEVLIPVLPMDTQKELTKQIQQSFKLRQESTKLIDIAKQAVEIAIEQDEKTAMKFIKDNT